MKCKGLDLPRQPPQFEEDDPAFGAAMLGEYEVMR